VVCDDDTLEQPNRMFLFGCARDYRLDAGALRCRRLSA
jgi:hypothetical protein